MKELDINELETINGGGIGIILTGVAALITFAIGAVKGYVHPQKCNN